MICTHKKHGHVLRVTITAVLGQLTGLSKEVFLYAGRLAKVHVSVRGSKRSVVYSSHPLVSLNHASHLSN